MARVVATAGGRTGPLAQYLLECILRDQARLAAAPDWNTVRFLQGCIHASRALLDAVEGAKPVHLRTTATPNREDS